MIEDIKILCVDDEKNVLTSLKRLFLDSEYEILTASSAGEGLELLRSNDPVHLIISDYRMPQMNGVDFLKKVYHEWPDTVRIVLSGYADTVAIVEAVNEGHIYKFIPKPWNDDELKIAISKALDHYYSNLKNIQLSGELESKNKELQEINRNLERMVEERTVDLLRQNRVLTCSQNILDELPVAVIGVDPEGLIVQCNRKGLDMFALEEGNIMGMDRRESFPVEINRFINRVAEQGEAAEIIVTSDSSFMVRAVHMKNSEGQEGIILVLEEGSDIR